MSAIYTVKSGSGIEDGIHYGKIKLILETERAGIDKKTKEKTTWKYTDIIIQVDGTENELKYSCPTPKGTINPKSKLGKVVSLFVPMEEGAPIDPEKVLVGKEIVFQTTTNDDGFSDVLEKSIKKK